MPASNDQTDAAFQSWLFELAKKWDWTPHFTADHLDDDYREIHNRATWYPKLALLLRRNNWSVPEFKRIASQCFTTSERFFAIRLNRMLEDEQEARQAIDDLVRHSPDNPSDIVHRINNFVDVAVGKGFTNSKKNADYAGAAYFASILLSARYPWNFVDYRTERWNRFTELLIYPKPSKNSSYGEKLVWAGKFADVIVQTPTFEKYWSHQGEPFWVIAGLCWHGPEPKKPTYIEEAFPEGRLIERRHKYRERNDKIVYEAKKQAYDRDHLLRCEVCGFSFKEKYGERGKGFIEAHHIIPLADLPETGRTRIDDLVMVCSNCHVMIHRRNPTLKLDELREMIK